MTAPRRAGPTPGASIGSVLAHLRSEFPDVTISKIRFLESEGLISPERTAAGYRSFSTADVDRLRHVLAAQRDHYLPLKVIKDQLDAMDDGGRIASLASASAGREVRRDGEISAEDFVPGDGRRLTREDLLERAGIDRAVLTELESFGLIRPGPAGFYGPDDVLVAATARAMTEFGLEPRHLRAFRASADREVGLLQQIVAPMARHRDPDTRARGDDVMRELAALSVRLHALLVRTGLRDSARG